MATSRGPTGQASQVESRVEIELRGRQSETARGSESRLMEASEAEEFYCSKMLRSNAKPSCETDARLRGSEPGSRETTTAGRRYPAGR
jgi:hypothetical protein